MFYLETKHVAHRDRPSWAQLPLELVKHSLFDPEDGRQDFS